MKLHSRTLANGLRLQAVEMPGTKVVTTMILAGAGSRYETIDLAGISHFLEHMFFKGTPKYPGAKLAGTIEAFGGEINAFTSFDYTCYYINTPSKYLNSSIDVLLDMVSNPSFFENFHISNKIGAEVNASMMKKIKP